VQVVEYGVEIYEVYELGRDIGVVVARGRRVIQNHNKQVYILKT